MSKRSASNKQFRNDTPPPDPTWRHISAVSASKQPSQPTERSRLRKKRFHRHKVASKEHVVQQRKPIAKDQNNSESNCQVKTDSKAGRRRKHFHGTHRQSSAPAGSQPLNGARMAIGIVDRRKSLASTSTRKGGSHKPRSQSNPPRSGQKGLHSSRSPAGHPTYVCAKHQRLADIVHKVRLSAGDSHLSELANDAAEVKAPASTNEATPRPKPASYTLPLVLTRKRKRREDPNQIPADAVHQAVIHRREYMRLRRKTSSLQAIDKNPNNCDIKLIKFHNVEIIEQHDPQMEQEGKVILKIIHKSRQLQQPQTRLNLISDEYNDLTKLMLKHMFKLWADVIKMWKLEGYLQVVEPYERVEYDAQQHRTPTLASPSSSSDSSADAEQPPSSDKLKQYVAHDQSQLTRKMVRQYLAKKGPAYQDTITTQLRYNFRRKKRFYPVHLMEHVIKYKRPLFWNYSRNYRGFDVLLNKYQLDNLYELVPPGSI